LLDFIFTKFMNKLGQNSAWVVDHDTDAYSIATTRNDITLSMTALVGG